MYDLSLKHDHSISIPITADDLAKWRKTCPICSISTEERWGWVKEAVELYKERYSSVPFYQAWGNDEASWRHFVMSRVVEAQDLLRQKKAQQIKKSSTAAQA